MSDYLMMNGRQIEIFDMQIISGERETGTISTFGGSTTKQGRREPTIIGYIVTKVQNPP